MIIKIPWKTPSVNHLYWHRGNIKMMKTEAKNSREDIVNLVPTKPENWDKDTMLKVTVKVHQSWFYQNGNIRRVDIANLEKFLIDSIFKAWEDMDDRQIFYQVFIKVEDKEEFSEVIIEECCDGLGY